MSHFGAKSSNFIGSRAEGRETRGEGREGSPIHHSRCHMPLARPMGHGETKVRGGMVFAVGKKDPMVLYYNTFLEREREA